MTDKSTGNDDNKQLPATQGEQEFRTLRPDVLELALKAVPWNNLEQSADIVAAAQKLGEQAELSRLEAAKSQAMEELRDQLRSAEAKGDDDLVLKIQTMIRSLAAAKSPHEITAALATAQPMIATLNGESKGDDKVVNIRALHDDLYQNDKLYREGTDKISAEAKKTLDTLDSKMSGVNKRAAEGGYKTAFDKDVEKAREEMESEKDPIEQARLRLKYYELLSKQNEARKEQAKTPEDAKLFGETAQAAIDKAKAEGLDQYKRQCDLFINRKRENLKAELNPKLSDDEIEQKITAVQNQINQDMEQMLKDANLDRIKSATESMVKLTNRLNQKSEEVKIDEKAEKKKPEISPTTVATEQKFAVTDVIDPTTVVAQLPAQQVNKSEPGLSSSPIGV